MARSGLHPRLLVGLMGAAALLAVAAVIGGIVWRQPRFAVEQMADRNPEIVFRVETTRPLVALTIDDGPHPTITARALDVLAAHGAHATFFLLGDHIPGNEALLERMRAEGHELGNHLVEDRPSILLPEEEFVRQLLVVDPWMDREARWRWLRPGSGWFSPGMVQLAADHGYRLCLGSIFPHDDRIHDAERLAATVLERVQAGDVIILHDGSDERAVLGATLDLVLAGLAERGLRAVTVSELVAGRRLGRAVQDLAHPPQQFLQAVGLAQEDGVAAGSGLLSGLPRARNPTRR